MLAMSNSENESINLGPELQAVVDRRAPIARPPSERDEASPSSDDEPVVKQPPAKKAKKAPPKKAPAAKKAPQPRASGKFSSAPPVQKVAAPSLVPQFDVQKAIQEGLNSMASQFAQKLPDMVRQIMRDPSPVPSNASVQREAPAPNPEMDISALLRSNTAKPAGTDKAAEEYIRRQAEMLEAFQKRVPAPPVDNSRRDAELTRQLAEEEAEVRRQETELRRKKSEYNLRYIEANPGQSPPFRTTTQNAGENPPFSEGSQPSAPDLERAAQSTHYSHVPNFSNYPGRQPPARDLLDASGLFSSDDRNRPMRPAAYLPPILSTQTVARRRPIFENSDAPMAFLNSFEEWAIDMHRDVDTARQYELPHCLKDTALHWHRHIGCKIPSWAEYCTAFIAAMSNRGEFEKIQSQAVSLVQADNEKLIDFIARKHQQLIFYWPELSEQKRVEKIVNLTNAKNRTPLQFRSVVTFAGLWEAATIVSAATECEGPEITPRDFSTDPHHIQKVESRAVKPYHVATRKPFVRFEQTKAKTDDKKPDFKPKVTEAKRGETPAPTRSFKTNVQPATDKTSRPPRVEAAKSASPRPAITPGVRLCHNCHQPGHFARECPKPKNPAKQQKALAIVQSYMLESGLMNCFAALDIGDEGPESDLSDGETDQQECDDTAEDAEGTHVGSDPYLGN
jgi:hypothetical protein